MSRVGILEAGESPCDPLSVEDGECQRICAEDRRSDGEDDGHKIVGAIPGSKRKLGDEGEPWQKPGAELLRENRPLESAGSLSTDFFTECVGHGGSSGTEINGYSVVIYYSFCPVRKCLDGGEAWFASDRSSSEGHDR